MKSDRAGWNSGNALDFYTLDVFDLNFGWDAG
jgi:hypothetical protein